MRVLFLHMYDPRCSGGPSTHLYSLSRELSNLGCEVHILALGSNTGDRFVEGFQVHYLKSRSYPGYGLMFSLFSVKKIKKLCEKYGIDIVHGQSPASAGYALLRDNRLPFVVTLHGTSFGEMVPYLKVPSSIFKPNSISALSIQSVTALLTCIEYKRADKLIAVSETTSREAAKYYRLAEDKIVIIPNGADFPNLRIDKQNAGDKHMILSAGRLVWRKGFEYLIKAMPSVLVEYPDARLIIVGPGSQETLRELVESLNLENSVALPGFVPTDTLHSLYAKASVYVQPSLYEPCGITVFEAMNMGNPIVGTRVGGIPEVVIDGESGIIVEPGNSLQLAEGIIRILSDPPYAKFLGANAKKRVQTEFTWRAAARKTLELYKNLI